MTRIVFVSDTHNQMDRVVVPDGDVLVHCGDATNLGTEREVAKFNADLGLLPHKRKLFVPGNHDWLFQRDPRHARVLMTHATVLIDEETTVDGLRFYLSPWQPAFCNWAFNLDKVEELQAVWAKIPEGIDVLATHGPPYMILDGVETMTGMNWEEGADLSRTYRHCGCPSLLDRVLKVKPRVHAFGHIHCAYGEQVFEGTHFVNAAICAEDYRPTNKPVVVDL